MRLKELFLHLLTKVVWKLFWIISLKSPIYSIDAVIKSIRSLSIEWRLEDFVVVAKCKQNVKTLTYSFADTKILSCLWCILLNWIYELKAYMSVQNCIKMFIFPVKKSWFNWCLCWPLLFFTFFEKTFKSESNEQTSHKYLKLTNRQPLPMTNDNIWRPWTQLKRPTDCGDWNRTHINK